MKIFELILSREGERIRICATDQPKQTLRQYEDKTVSFNRIDDLCNEILSILNRTNHRGDMADRLIRDLKKTGQDLLDELLTPNAKKSLFSTQCNTLSLHIDEQLVHIPWELLYDGKQFLCRRFSIGRTVSTRQEIPGSRSRAIGSPIKMLIIADPQGNLDAAYREGIQLRDHLVDRGDRIKTDLVSSRVDTRFVRRHIRDYDIVHYTGHSEYHEPGPSESGWLLSDGTLAASEIKDLTGETPFPFLVFSNACHSGPAGQWRIEKEYEREIYHLANTFLHCGVTHYIGTFLEIVDSPGAAFAAEFYRALGEEASVGEAVRTAREHLVERFGEGNIIWASYMLYGDPSYKLPPVVPEKTSRPGAHSRFTYVIAFLLVLAAVYFGGNELNSPPAPPEKVPAVQIAASPASLEISFMHIAGLREEDGAAVREILSEGSRMYVYDRFDFVLSSSRDAFYYLLISDTQGKIDLLSHFFGDHPDNVYTKTEHSVPLAAHHLQLDENPAARVIYIVASGSKLNEIETVLWEIEELNESVGGVQARAQMPDDRSEYVIVVRIEISNGKVMKIL